jgi:hypothetical protein
MYQGKEILREPSNLNNINSVMDTPPFQVFRQESKLAYLVSLFDSIPDLASLLIKMPITLLESIHGINRAFNSTKYNNLNQIGTNILTNSRYEKSLYEGVFKAYHNSLDINYLQSVLQENNINSVSIEGGNPQAEMQSWQTDSISLFDRFFDSITNRLDALKNIGRKLTADEQKQRSRLSWELFELNGIWTQLQSLLGGTRQIEVRTQNSELRTELMTEEEIARLRQLILNPNRIMANPLTLNDFYNLPKTTNETQRTREFSFNNGCTGEWPFPPMPCTGDRPFAPSMQRYINHRQAIIATPMDMLNIMQEMSNFFLSFFGTPANINLLPALSYTVSNMVLKSIGSSGAMATRYFAGHILRQNTRFLPVIVQNTGMWGMAWGYLAPLAPWLILTAVTITVGIRKNMQLGENLYLFGSNGGSLPDMSYLVLSDSNNKEIYDTIVQQAQTMRFNSGKNYPQLYGFSTHKDKPQFGLNLSDENNVTMMDKSQLNTFDNYLSSIAQRHLW